MSEKRLALVNPLCSIHERFLDRSSSPYTKRVVAARNLANGTGGAGGATLTHPQIFIAGFLAGLANAFVSGPWSTFASAQYPTSPPPAPYAGPLSAIRKIYAAHGLGGVFTFVREAAGYGVYFLSYEKLVQRGLQLHPGMKREELSPVKAVLWYMQTKLWAIIHQIDMIKSRMQTDAPPTGQKYKSAIDCVRTVWRTEGVAAFTHGLTPTLIRSPFANGATFLGFEMASRVLNSS
ncbi:mitochondrial carrier domain-containing protein [Mycena metata]|uniref:Mitochondrial carrier domain-containing protein n=1 Tax=Mycena metata TaxID=1033252 RepID=A0AAD7JSY4_9AGAR|nr:mitochondrial carrier domain-containing protein [Mycena metata]